MKIRKGSASGKRLKVGLIVSRFNETITSRLMEGALRAFEEAGVSSRSISVISVPGAFELGPAALKLAAAGKVDAIACVGAVIRGETEHFTYVSAAAQQGVLRAAMDSGIPVTFGVLTTDTVDQALERAGGSWGNKGYEAAMSAVELANLHGEIQGG